MTIEETYIEVAVEWDRATKAWEELFGYSFPCKAGCSDCCKSSVAGVPFFSMPMGVSEAALLREALGVSLSEAQRDRLIERRMTGHRQSCLLLEDDRCVVYEARPLWCRVFGLFGNPTCGRVPSVELDPRWQRAVGRAFGKTARQDLVYLSEVIDNLITEG